MTLVIPTNHMHFQNLGMSNPRNTQLMLIAHNLGISTGTRYTSDMYVPNPGISNNTQSGYADIKNCRNNVRPTQSKYIETP